MGGPTEIICWPSRHTPLTFKQVGAGIRVTDAEGQSWDLLGVVDGDPSNPDFIPWAEVKPWPIEV